MREYTFPLVWDNKTGKWYAINDEIPYTVEDESLDSLMKRVKEGVPEILELNGKGAEHFHILFVMRPQEVMV